jgi:hypothetical protein
MAKTRSEQDMRTHMLANRPIWEKPHRVGYSVFADNTRYSKAKKIDAIGTMCESSRWPGLGWVCEVKERQGSNARFPFSIFDRDDNNGMDQDGHLQCVHDAGAFACIWFQEINGQRRGQGDRAVLFTWKEWLELKGDPPVREFKHADDTDYKSVSIDDILERYPWAEMIYHQGQWWSHLEVELGFRVELPLLHGYPKTLEEEAYEDLLGAALKYANVMEGLTV